MPRGCAGADLPLDGPGRDSSCWSRTAPSTARPTGSSTIRRSWRSASAPRLGHRPKRCPTWSTTVLAEHGLARASVACVVSLDLKAAEPAVHALAAALGVPARFFPAERLLARDRPPRHALRGRVPRDRLLGRRRRCGPGGGRPGRPPPGAQAQGRAGHLRRRPGAARPAARHPIGRPQGRLAVVGLGPGDLRWRTAEAERLLAEAEELVGYGLYLDLIGPAAAGKPRHEFPLGAEVERCRFALEPRRRGPQRGPGLLRRSRHLRPGDAGVRAAGERRRSGLGARRRHRQPRRLRAAGGGRRRRRARSATISAPSRSPTC